MKLTLINNLLLNNISDSYLLLEASGRIITNTNHKELLVLNHNLEKLKTIVLPESENQITLNPETTFMFDRTTFITTNQSTAKFVILTTDKSSKKDCKLQLFEVINAI